MYLYKSYLWKNFQLSHVVPFNVIFIQIQDKAFSTITMGKKKTLSNFEYQPRASSSSVLALVPGLVLKLELSHPLPCCGAAHVVEEGACNGGCGEDWDYTMEVKGKQGRSPVGWENLSGLGSRGSCDVPCWPGGSFPTKGTWVALPFTLSCHSLMELFYCKKGDCPKIPQWDLDCFHHWIHPIPHLF